LGLEELEAASASPHQSVFDFTRIRETNMIDRIQMCSEITSGSITKWKKCYKNPGLAIRMEPKSETPTHFFTIW